MYYEHLFSLIGSLLVLAGGIYLLIIFKSQKSKNYSTLAWGLGLFCYAISIGILICADMNLARESSQQESLLLSLAHILTTLFLFAIYWGITRLVLKNKFLIHYLPLVIFIFVAVCILFRSIIFTNYSNFIMFWSLVFLLPGSLIVAIIFFILYGILVAEEAGRNIGPLLIAISWLIFAGSAIIFREAIQDNLIIHFLFLRSSHLVLLLIGLILLNKEARDVLEILREEREKIKKTGLW